MIMEVKHCCTHHRLFCSLVVKEPDENASSDSLLVHSEFRTQRNSRAARQQAVEFAHSQELYKLMWGIVNTS